MRFILGYLERLRQRPRTFLTTGALDRAGRVRRLDGGHLGPLNLALGEHADRMRRTAQLLDRLGSQHPEHSSISTLWLCWLIEAAGRLPKVVAAVRVELRAWQNLHALYWPRAMHLDRPPMVAFVHVTVGEAGLAGAAAAMTGAAPRSLRAATPPTL
jgi:hypothetical protein